MNSVALAFNGLHSRTISQRYLHTLGKIQHDHYLQATALNAVQDKRIDWTEQRREQETNRGSLKDCGHAENRIRPH